MVVITLRVMLLTRSVRSTIMADSLSHTRSVRSTMMADSLPHFFLPAFFRASALYNGQSAVYEGL